MAPEPPAEYNNLHFRVYADASFETNQDLSPKIGYIVLLCDHTGVCHIFYYSSKKSKPLSRSILAVETIAFMEASDSDYMIKHDM